MLMKEHPLAVVTGAAHRLGRSFALSLAQQGYAILLHYHQSVDEAKATFDEIRLLDVPVELVQADLTVIAQIESLFSVVDGLSFPLKILVNSAAVMPRGNVRSLSVPEWDLAMDLNLRAPFFCAQHAAARMESGGLIINLSDIGAAKAWSGFPAYTVSKAALESLTRVLARSFAPSVRVNAIAPGLVLPSDNLSQEEWEKLVGRVPLERAALLDEISAALQFLVENEYITGQTITVDGGYSLV
jgi:pteridine reductase